MRVQKKLDGGGDERTMHNLQGKAGGIVLDWFREEKAAVRDRAMDWLWGKGCFKIIRPPLFSMAKVGGWAEGSHPPSKSPERLTLASLQQAELGNLLRSLNLALPWIAALCTTSQRQGSMYQRWGRVVVCHCPYSQPFGIPFWNEHCD